MNQISPLRISEPGIYELQPDQYHADPCEVPSLSCSIARSLVRRSPKHAWQAHPRLGNIAFEPSRVMDDGSTVHAMMLGQSHLIEPLRTVYGSKTKKKDLIGKPVLDFKTEAAQDERDEIRGMGKIPVLVSRLAELTRCKIEAEQQIAAADDGHMFFAPSRSEVAAISREDDIMLRCLVDRLPDDEALPPLDLKCTELSAAPGGWERRLQLEYAFQDAFYARVLNGAGRKTTEPMRFIVVELDPPHGTVIMGALPALRAIAEAEVERAIQRWRSCMQAGLWHRYPPHTVWVDATGWQITQAEDAAVREKIAAESAENPFFSA